MRAQSSGAAPPSRGYFLHTTRPARTTTSMSCVAVMETSGSPPRTTRSAALPGSRGARRKPLPLAPPRE
jgi:hypothetical protein